MRVLIVRNKHNSEAVTAELTLEMFFANQGIEYTSFDSDEIRMQDSTLDPMEPSWIDDYDMAVVLGGDGTILATAAIIGYRRIPIMGINFGHLGFMANEAGPGVIPLVAAALEGDVRYEHRTNLKIDVYCSTFGFEDGHVFSLNDKLPEHPTRNLFGLNEIALARGNHGKIMDFSYAVDGEKICDLRGDGLIIATATGSTGYGLSAGGPLMAPSHGGLEIVPLSPHTLHSRAVITAPSDVVEVVMRSTKANREASMFVDGNLLSFEDPIRRVIVAAGPEPTILLRYGSEKFYGLINRTFF